MAALRLAYSPFWKALKRIHRKATPATLVCRASTASAAAASSAMQSVQRCRRPRSQPGGETGGDGAEAGHDREGGDLVLRGDVLQLDRDEYLQRRERGHPHAEA